jgi:hypothetical protein
MVSMVQRFVLSGIVRSPPALAGARMAARTWGCGDAAVVEVGGHGGLDEGSAGVAGGVGVGASSTADGRGLR